VLKAITADAGPVEEQLVDLAINLDASKDPRLRLKARAIRNAVIPMHRFMGDEARRGTPLSDLAAVVTWTVASLLQTFDHNAGQGGYYVDQAIQYLKEHSHDEVQPMRKGSR
jgi:hypothetical protein